MVNYPQGTITFSAPEIFKNPYDPIKADVWSLGILLYSLLNAGYPFSENISQIPVKQQIEECEVNYPEFFNPKVVELIKKMLIKDPMKRITLEEVLNDPWIKLGRKSTKFIFHMPCNHFFQKRLPLLIKKAG